MKDRIVRNNDMLLNSYAYTKTSVANLLKVRFWITVNRNHIQNTPQPDCVEYYDDCWVIKFMSPTQKVRIS